MGFFFYSSILLHRLNSLAILECNVTLDNACGNGLVTKGDAVEMMHVGVHLVYCCLRPKREMRISE